MDEKKIFDAAVEADYNANVKIDSNLKIRCYSKKQMKKLYPNGDFEVVGDRSIKTKTETDSAIKVGQRTYPLTPPKKHNGFFNSVKYIQCANGSFVSVCTNLLPLYFSIIILAAAIAFSGYTIYEKFASPVANNTSPTPPTVDVDPNAQSEKPTAPVDKDGESGIQIPGFKEATIKANTKDVVLSLENPKDNTCYFVMKLMLIADGTQQEEILYETKMVPPGQGVYNLKLSRPLPAGKYKAKIQYSTFDMETNKPKNGATMAFDLIAE